MHTHKTKKLQKLGIANKSSCQTKKKQKKNITPYFRDYKFQIVSLTDFLNIKEFDSKHPEGNNRFRIGELPLKDSSTVIKYIIKSHRDPPKSKSYTSLLLSINEIMASLIYNRVFRLYAPDVILVQGENGEYFIGSRYDQNIQSMSYKSKHSDFIKGFLVDCIMANWDVVVPGNSFYTKKNNNNHTKLPLRALRLDVGGSMSYRARGEIKPSFVNGNTPDEHKTLKKYNTFFLHLMTPANIDKSLNYIRELYLNGGFDALDSIAEEMITKIQAHKFTKTQMKHCLELIHTNTRIIKHRWDWYLNHFKK